MSRVEVEYLKRAFLVKRRLLQWRLLSRRRPPARWFSGPGAGAGVGSSSNSSVNSVGNVHTLVTGLLDNDYQNAKQRYGLK